MCRPLGARLSIGLRTVAYQPHLYPHFQTDFVLVLNEMVLVLVLDCSSDRVRARVLPFGRSTSTKNPWELECGVQRYG
jgi:hypothetical protein